MTTQLGFSFDQTRCNGCKACQVACQDKHDLPATMRWRRVVEYVGGTWSLSADNTYDSNVFAYYVSVGCNHCVDPPCVDACPSTAMHKDPTTGIVSVDQSVCIGCRYCEMACPYGAPQYDASRNVMTKCDFCADDVAAGKEPACVAACPTRALGFGDISDLTQEHGDVRAVAPLPDPAMTQPCYVVIPHRDAQPWDRATGTIANPEEL